MSNGIISALHTSAKALNVYSRGVQVAGNNIAQMQTPGYARQVIVTGPRDYYDAGDGIRNTGVEVLALRQMRDQVLDRQIIAEIKTRGSLDAQKTVFDLMENTLGDTIGRSSGSLSTLDGTPEDNLGGSGLSKAMDEFLGGWHELSATPNLSTTKAVVLQSAEVLVEQFHVTAQRLSSLDAEVSSRIQTDADAVEGILDKIGSVNESIARLEVGAEGTAAELRSERQQLLEDLSQYIDFTSAPSAKNPGAMIDIFVGVSGSSNQIQLLSGGQRFTDLTYNGTDLLAGEPPQAVDLTNGSIYGYHQARTNELTATRNSLNALASQVIDAVNAAYNPTAAVGEDFFTGSDAATIAVRADLTPINLRTTDVGVTTGGNAIALAVAALSEQVFSVAGTDSIDGTFNDFVVGLGSSIGSYVDQTEAKIEAQDIVQKHLEAQRDAVGGVNLDEEVTNMMRFQRSYQAASRVISILDEMLETLVRGF